MAQTTNTDRESKFRDGLGTRVVVTDATGDAVEQLRLTPEIANQETSIRERVGRLVNFRHVKYVRLRGIDRLKQGGKELVVAYDAVEGDRLSTILEVAAKIPLVVETDVALQIVRDLLPGIGILHDSRKVTHGAIAPERLIYTAQHRLIIVDHGFGLALGRMNQPRKKLWDQYRIAVPGAGKSIFDERTDVVQIGIVALSALLGRPLADEEYPAQLKRLVLSVKEHSAKQLARPISPELRQWLERALPIDDEHPFKTVRDAQDAFETLVAKGRYAPSAAKVKAFLTRYRATATALPEKPAASSGAPSASVDRALEEFAITVGPKKPVSKSSASAPVAETTGRTTAPVQPAVPMPPALPAAAPPADTAQTVVVASAIEGHPESSIVPMQAPAATAADAPQPKSLRKSERLSESLRERVGDAARRARQTSLRSDAQRTAAPAADGRATEETVDAPRKTRGRLDALRALEEELGRLAALDLVMPRQPVAAPVEASVSEPAAAIEAPVEFAASPVAEAARVEPETVVGAAAALDAVAETASASVAPDAPSADTSRLDAPGAPPAVEITQRRPVFTNAIDAELARLMGERDPEECATPIWTIDRPETVAAQNDTAAEAVPELQTAAGPVVDASIDVATAAPTHAELAAPEVPGVAAVEAHAQEAEVRVQAEIEAFNHAEVEVHSVEARVAVETGAAADASFELTPPPADLGVVLASFELTAPLAEPLEQPPLFELSAFEQAAYDTYDAVAAELTGRQQDGPLFDALPVEPVAPESAIEAAPAAGALVTAHEPGVVEAVPEGAALFETAAVLPAVLEAEAAAHAVPEPMPSESPDAASIAAPFADATSDEPVLAVVAEESPAIAALAPTGAGEAAADASTVAEAIEPAVMAAMDEASTTDASPVIELPAAEAAAPAPPPRFRLALNRVRQLFQRTGEPTEGRVDAHPGADAEAVVFEPALAAEPAVVHLEDARIEAERADIARLESARVEAERLEAARLEAERLELECFEATRREAELEAARQEAARAEAARLESERQEAVRLEAERLEAVRLEAERLEAERIEAARRDAERLEAARQEAVRAEAAARLGAERLEAARLEAARLDAERIEAARREADRLEAARQEAARAEAAARLQAERLDAARLEAERFDAERIEAVRREAERLEAARQEAARAEAAARLESGRLEAARLEAERLDAERIEAARREAERLEAARQEAARAEAAARLESERLEAARLETERLEAARQEAARAEAARLEAERLEAARLEAVRLEAERLEAARLAALDGTREESTSRRRRGRRRNRRNGQVPAVHADLAAADAVVSATPEPAPWQSADVASELAPATFATADPIPVPGAEAPLAAPSGDRVDFYAWEAPPVADAVPAWARGTAHSTIDEASDDSLQGIGAVEFATGAIAAEAPGVATETPIGGVSADHTTPASNVVPFAPPAERGVAAGASGVAVQPAPPSPVRVRRSLLSHINWGRTLAASLVVALLEGVAFAAAWWYVTPTELGWLIVHTRPAGIEISVDGMPRGQTPFAISLKPGRHTIELRQGTATRVIPVEISGGVQTEQRITWGKAFKTGQARITSTPEGARVLIDGKAYGKTPLTVSELSAGKHLVAVESSSGSVSSSLIIESGETTELDVPVFSGWVSVLSPVELEIFERERLIGTTEAEKIMLAPGRHKLQFKNDSLGYDGMQMIEIRPGATTSVSVLPKAEVSVEGPAGAELFLDGERLGELPTGTLQVPIGTREFVIRHQEQGERRQVVVVTTAAGQSVKF